MVATYILPESPWFSHAISTSLRPSLKEIRLHTGSPKVRRPRSRPGSVTNLPSVTKARSCQCSEPQVPLSSEGFELNVVSSRLSIQLSCSFWAFPFWLRWTFRGGHCQRSLVLSVKWLPLSLPLLPPGDRSPPCPGQGCSGVWRDGFTGPFRLCHSSDLRR